MTSLITLIYLLCINWFAILLPMRGCSLMFLIMGLFLFLFWQDNHCSCLAKGVLQRRIEILGYFAETLTKYRISTVVEANKINYQLSSIGQFFAKKSKIPLMYHWNFGKKNRNFIEKSEVESTCMEEGLFIYFFSFFAKNHRFIWWYIANLMDDFLRLFKKYKFYIYIFIYLSCYYYFLIIRL